MSVPIATFSDGSDVAPPSVSRQNPRATQLHDRFVGDYLLNTDGSGWVHAQKSDRSNLYAARWADGAGVSVTLPEQVVELRTRVRNDMAADSTEFSATAKPCKESCSSGRSLNGVIKGVAG
jgi:hypothetical protein